MTIAYVGRAANISDGGSQDGSAARGFAWPALTTGAKVLVEVVDASGAGTVSVSNAGNQTWTTETQGGITIIRRLFHCTFNGDSSVNPTFVNSTLHSSAFTVAMIAWDPTAAGTWSTDVAMVSTGHGVPSGPPYDSTDAGQTPTAGASVVTYCAWASIDDNQWALQTGAWVNPGGITQIRNGGTTSLSPAYLIQASAVATGTVTNRQTANGPDANASNIITFKETLSAVAAVLSSATPSGTIASPLTATLGCTTDQTSGTLYGVVDSAANLSGVTKAQVKAGQKAAGTAALASGNASVTTTTPTIDVTGLVAATAYSYALVQNNANGDSNLLTGTFTTAAAPLFTQYNPSVPQSPIYRM